MIFDIKHDGKGQKFFIVINGKECNLKYEKLSDQIFEVKQMFVPKNLRGQGIAGRIAEYCLNFAKANFIKIKTSCSYIHDFIEKRKEYKDLLITTSSKEPAVIV